MIGVADAVGSGLSLAWRNPVATSPGQPYYARACRQAVRALKKCFQALESLYGLWTDPAHRLFVKDTQDAAQSFKVGFQPLVLKSVDEIDGAFQSMAKQRVGVLIVQPLFSSGLGQGPRIAALGENRIPTISDGFSRGIGRNVLWARSHRALQRAATLSTRFSTAASQPNWRGSSRRSFNSSSIYKSQQIGLTIPSRAVSGG